MAKTEEIIEERPLEFYQFLSECVRVAGYHGTISYEAIGETIDEIPLGTRPWMGAVAAEMEENGHSMLTAVIVNKGDRTPGEGFYQLAHEIGKLEENPEQLSEDEKLEFWEAEREAVYEMFGR